MRQELIDAQDRAAAAMIQGDDDDEQEVRTHHNIKKAILFKHLHAACLLMLMQLIKQKRTQCS